MELATDQPTSPHLLVSKIKAEVYVAGADQDAQAAERGWKEIFALYARTLR